LEWKCRL